MSLDKSPDTSKSEQDFVADDDIYNGLYPHFHVVKYKEAERDEKYKEYRKKWRAAAVSHKITPFPLHLDIEVTSHCNLKCPMCPRTHRVELGQWTNKHMSFETFKKIIDEGVELGLSAINLNNFGESLMNKDLCKMIRYAKDKGVVDIMLHSNGSLLNKQLTKDLIESGIHTIIFSVDAISKELYEGIRIGSNFERTISRIKAFAAMRKEMGSVTPHIRISMVRMKENAHEAELFDAFWGDHADTITYVDYRNQDGLDTADRYVTSERRQNLSYACPALWQRMTINATGEITACCRDAGKRLTLGDMVKNKTLLEVWNGESMKNARALHEAGEAYKLEACNGCDHIRGRQPTREETLNKE